MNNGVLARLKYFRGQMLTAQDFEDQQEYHREKQRLLLRRFPAGIIQGLLVTCSKKDDKDPADVDSFEIGEGLAVDPQGNELIVPKEGIKVPVSKFDKAKPYLSIVYHQGEDFVGGDFCGGNQKNNRITEGVEVVWDTNPNSNMSDPDPLKPSHVTVAFIRYKEGKDSGTTCDDFRNPMDPKVEPDEPPVFRINARVVDTEQLTGEAVTEEKIKGGAVTARKLAIDAVITEKIQNGAVNTDKLADGAVVGNKIPDLSIITDKLALDAIVTNRIKNEQVIDTKLATDSVVEVKIKDANVTERKLANNAVTSAKILDGHVIDTKLATDSVIEVKIRDENVTERKLAGNAVVEVKIKDENVTERKLATDAVTNLKIKDGAVTRNKLATDAQVATQVANGAITDAQLADNAVIETKIMDGNVTELKLGDSAVTSAKLGTDSVIEVKIRDENVTERKLAPDAVGELKIKDANVTERKLAPDAVTNIKIQDGAVTSAKLSVMNPLIADGLVPEAVAPALPPTVRQFPLPPVSTNSIVHVVPTNGSNLSWSFTVQHVAADNTLIYTISVTNPGTTPVTFEVREFRFN